MFPNSLSCEHDGALPEQITSLKKNMFIRDCHGKAKKTWKWGLSARISIAWR